MGSSAIASTLLILLGMVGLIPLLLLVMQERQQPPAQTTTGFGQHPARWLLAGTAALLLLLAVPWPWTSGPVAAGALGALLGLVATSMLVRLASGVRTGSPPVVPINLFTAALACEIAIAALALLLLPRDSVAGALFGHAIAAALIAAAIGWTASIDDAGAWAMDQRPDGPAEAPPTATPERTPLPAQVTAAYATHALLTAAMAAALIAVGTRGEGVAILAWLLAWRGAMLPVRHLIVRWAPHPPGWRTALVAMVVAASLALTLTASLLGPLTVGGDLILVGLLLLGMVLAIAIPALTGAATGPGSRHAEEVVEASNHAGASLQILAGLTAGWYSACWLGALLVAALGLVFGLTKLLPAGFGVAGVPDWVVSLGVTAIGLGAMAAPGWGPNGAASIGAPETVHRGTQTMSTAAFLACITAGVLATGQTSIPVITSPPVLFGIMYGGAASFWFTGALMQAAMVGSLRRTGRPDGGRRRGWRLTCLLGFTATALALAAVHAGDGFRLGFIVGTALFCFYQALAHAGAAGSWHAATLSALRRAPQIDGDDLHGLRVGMHFGKAVAPGLIPFMLLATGIGVLPLLGGEGSLPAALATAALASLGVAASFLLVRIPVARPTKPSEQVPEALGRHPIPSVRHPISAGSPPG